MADKKYKLSLQLTIDGNQAKQEAQRTGKAIESIADSQKGALRLLVDGSQARKELEAIANLARKTAQIIENPRTFARPAVDLGVKQGPAALSSGISGSRLKVLPGMDKQQLEKLDKLKAKSVTMTIDADGSLALAEADKTQKEIDDKGKKLKPWSVRMYDKTFKGFGGDLSKMIGLDKVNAGIQSGLGKTLGWLNLGFAAVGKAAGFAFRGISAGVRLVGSIIKTGLTLPVKLATGAFKALGVAAAAVGAGVYAGLKAIKPAADMEQYSIQLEVMLKNAGKAKARLAELSKYAKKTNYGVKEIMEAGNLMEAFGFYSKRNLELAGDAANAFGKDIREVIYSLNYLASGRGGEAFRSLATIGVTREKLEPYGIKFNNSGQMITDSKKAFDAVLKYFEDQFGGMTARQSKTWRGATQRLGGEVYKAFADGFKDAVKPLTEFVNDKVIPLVDSIRERLGKIDWKKNLATPLKIAGGLVEMLRQITDPKTSKAGMQNAKVFGKELWGSVKDALGLLPGIGKAFLKDFAVTLERFLSSDGMGKIFDIAWQGMKLSWEFGASLLSQVLTGFSDNFQSRLKASIELLPNVRSKSETNKRKRAEWEAVRGVLLKTSDTDLFKARMAVAKEKSEEAYKQAGNDYIETHHTVVPEKMEEFRRRRAANVYEVAMKTHGNEEFQKLMAKHLRKQNSDIEKNYQEAFRKAMGWGDPTQAPLYRDPEKLKEQLGTFTGKISSLKIEPSFANLEAETEGIGKKIKEKFSKPAEMLNEFDTMGRRRTYLEGLSSDLANRKKALIDDPELKELQSKGWKKVKNKETGKDEWQERTSSNDAKRLSYQQAREEHWRRSALIRNQVANIDGQIRKVEAAKAREAQRVIKNQLPDEVRDSLNRPASVLAENKRLKALKAELSTLESKTVNVATEADLSKIKALKAELSTLESKTVNVNVDVNLRKKQQIEPEKLPEPKQNTQTELNKLQDKTNKMLEGTNTLLAQNALQNGQIIRELQKMFDILQVVLEA